MEVADLSHGWFFTADTVHRVADGALPLPYGVLAVDVGHVGHVEKNAVDELLHDGQFLHNRAIEHLAGTGGFSFEQRRGRIDADGIGDAAHFERHVDAWRFVDAEDESGPHEAFKAGGFDGDIVTSGGQIGHIISAGGAGEALVDGLGTQVPDSNFGVGDHGAGRVTDVTNDSSGAC